jgi:hypothetical protein
MKHGALNVVTKANDKVCKVKQLTSSRHKKARILKPQMKTVLTTFLGIKGIVHFEFISQRVKGSTKLITWKC